MNYRRWVVDASMSYPGEGIFCFCPLDEAENVVTGMNLLAADPPAGSELVAVVHLDGQEAVEKFMVQYGPIVREIAAKRLSQQVLDFAPEVTA